jgi:hypothetical protein
MVNSMSRLLRETACEGLSFAKANAVDALYMVLEMHKVV